MDSKACFKCGQVKSRGEFYAHPAMADGLLGKCKECTKKDVAANYRVHRLRFAAYERERFQRPERKAAALKYQRRRRAKAPEKNIARAKVTYAVRTGKLIPQPCEITGCKGRPEAHHEDYSKPLDVRWLCFQHHRQEHGQAPLSRGHHANR